VAGESINTAIVVRDLRISPPVVLAPMVGLSHSAFRSLLAEAGGVWLFFTEMLAARRLPHDNARISPLLIKSEAEKPLIYQIITADENYVQAAVDKLHLLDADGVDLNLGCPAPSQRHEGAGRFLAENPKRLKTVLRALRKATALPLSVKIRLGSVMDVVRLRSFCRYLESEGVDMITVHARLSGEKFCRKPRWQAVGEIRDAVTVPLVVNGGVFSVEDAVKCLEQSGADGIMIGRGALEDPGLCAAVAREIYGMEAEGHCRDKAELLFRYIELLEERFPRERQLGRLKNYCHYFSAPLLFGHHLAAGIQKCNNMEEARQVAGHFFRWK
jgi:tRNA-dihydrouridine synthase B